MNSSNLKSLAISRERFSHENSTNTTFCYVSSFSFSFLHRLYIFLSFIHY